MKKLSITIEDGRFTGYEGTEVNETWRPDYISGNGWCCVVDHNGTITCTATKKYADGKHTMTFKLIPGKMRQLTLEKPATTGRKKIKTAKMEEGPINGVIVLSDGRIDNREAYLLSKK